MYRILNKFIKYRHGGEYYRWTYFPPWPNTNDIIEEEYQIRVPLDIPQQVGPKPNLSLTSITYNPNGNNNGGWWCGYGWKNSIIIFLIENFKKIIKKIELNIAYYFKVYVKRIIKYECLSIL